MSDEVRRGRCLCGEVHFELRGAPAWSGFCHCESCRRTCSAPVAAFFAMPNGAWRRTGREPSVYRSSPGVRRFFCPRCGTPVAYATEKYPDEMDFYAAALDDPLGFAAQLHVYYDARLPWFDTADALPRHRQGAASETAPKARVDESCLSGGRTMSDDVKRGRCLCGDVRFEYTGPENWRGYCHCESCRRNCSAPVTAYLGVPNGAWRFTGEEASIYHSSPGVRRLFCGRCGTPMAYSADKFPDELHFYAASLEEPAAYAPDFHVFYGEHLPWFDTADDLPRHARSTNSEALPKG